MALIGLYDVGVLIIRTGFGGRVYYNYKKEPPKGPYIKPHPHLTPSKAPKPLESRFQHPLCFRSESQHEIIVNSHNTTSSKEKLHVRPSPPMMPKAERIPKPPTTTHAVWGWCSWVWVDSYFEVHGYL